jgi:hypothetical protein
MGLRRRRLRMPLHALRKRMRTRARLRLRRDSQGRRHLIRDFFRHGKRAVQPKEAYNEWKQYEMNGE